MQNLIFESFNNKFTTALFDKRNGSELRLYASVGFEILHIAMITTDLINIVTGVNLFLIRMKNQDSECTCILLKLKKIYGKHIRVQIQLKIY